MSVEYESLIRETCDDAQEDARHRSCALALRARSLYLRSQYCQPRFRQALHWLDCASAGLGAERMDHRVAMAVIHVCRAELLAMSAGHHYDIPDGQTQYGDEHLRTSNRGPRTRTDVDRALKKIERAEAELAR